MSNILTSGFSFSKDDNDEKLNYILFNSMLLASMFLIFAAAFFRLYEQNYTQAVFDFSFAFILFGIILIARISRKYFDTIFYILIILSYVMATLSYVYSRTVVGGIGWYYIILMMHSFVKGYKEGTILFALSVITIVAIGVIENDSFVSLMTGMMPFVVAYFFILFYEKRNENHRKVIEAQKNMYAYQANYDKLTGVVNREFFFEYLEKSMNEAVVSGEKLAILFIDMDGFKEINDSYGHQIGDKVLIETARRIKTHLNDGDLLARFGGDEFAVLLRDLDENSLDRTISSLRKTAKESMFVSVEDIDMTVVVDKPIVELDISFSIGYAIFPDDGMSQIALMGKADREMYRAKRAKTAK